MNRKAGITFPLLTAVFTFILFFFASLTLVLPLEKSPDALKFGETLVELQLAELKTPAQQYFLENSISKVISDVQNSLGKDLVSLGSSECVDLDTEIFYFYREDINNQERVVGLDEEGNEILQTINPCIPILESEIGEEIVLLSESKVNVFLLTSVSSIDATDYSSEIEYDEENQKLGINIDYTIQKETDVSRIEIQKEYSQEFGLGPFVELYQRINLILPQLSETFTTELPICVLESGDPQGMKEECIENIIRDQIIVEDLENYYELEAIYESATDNMFEVEVIIINKELNKVEVNFFLRFEDRVPFNYIEYTLENFKSNNNVISLRIPPPEEPGKDLFGFIVLYSYESFFNEEYQGYESLISALTQGQIPRSFDEIFEFNGNVYYKGNNGLEDINVVFAKWEGARQVGDEIVSPVILSQIYDGGRFVRFENKPVNIFVFAVDDKFNYYINEPLLEEYMRTIIPETFFGPRPVTSSEVIIKNNRQVEGGLAFSVGGYDDPAFNHYDIYITKDRNGKELLNGCLQTTYECHYYTGQELLTSTNAEILVAPFNSQPNPGEILIDTFAFAPPIQFEADTPYELFVIPSSSDLKVSISEEQKGYDFVEHSFQGIDYFKLQSTNSQKLTLNPKEFEIRDTTAPDPLTSIQVFGIVQCSGDKFCLQWASIAQGDVQYLNVDIKAFDALGELKKISTNQRISLDNSQLHSDFTTQYATIIVDNIIPIDYSGNKVINYQGETYEARWP